MGGHIRKGHSGFEREQKLVGARIHGGCVFKRTNFARQSPGIIRACAYLDQVFRAILVPRKKINLKAGGHVEVRLKEVDKVDEVLVA